ncbi:tail completion protein gp17 [Tritonibacter mobilis]|uniref:tail completion protein gp17 n=1 Tax=Tritonibacter mobilis TaxID=379347 RepID=UPI0008068232|nr:DUF3168 domain-containing protein [Tritonibacter mobilis]
MHFELRAILRASAPVAALCANRVDWGARPQGDDYPAIALHQVGGTQGHTLQGTDGLFQGRVQVDCYALHYSEARTLAQAVKLTLDGYRQDGFRGVFLMEDRDTSERGSNEADRPCRVSLDFFVNWRTAHV